MCTNSEQWLYNRTIWFKMCVFFSCFFRPILNFFPISIVFWRTVKNSNYQYCILFYWHFNVPHYLNGVLINYKWLGVKSPLLKYFSFYTSKEESENDACTRCIFIHHTLFPQLEIRGVLALVEFLYLLHITCFNLHLHIYIYFLSSFF